MEKNICGSCLMTLAMFAFTLEDMFVKAASVTLPPGEIMIVFGVGGTLVFSLLAVRKGQPFLHPQLVSRPLILRMLCEITGRLGFVFAIALTPLSCATAILQATPLVVVPGAVFFLKEQVSWRQWSSIFMGFAGVLLLVQPGLDDFQAASLFAVLSTLGFAGRDLATRTAPNVFSNIQLGVYGFFVLIPAGLLVVPFTGGLVWPDVRSFAAMLGAIFWGVSAYYALTVAMRTGQIAVVTLFRYSRLVFGLLAGVLIFSEEIGYMILVGSLIIVLSGGVCVCDASSCCRLLKKWRIFC